VPDINRFTGAKFKGLPAFKTYANQALPQVEENIDFRFLMTMIDADNTCMNCPFEKDEQPTVDRVLLLYTPANYDNVGIKDEFEYFYTPGSARNIGWSGYFLAKALKRGHMSDFPPGSIPLGRIGRIKRGFLKKDIPLNAFIYATNWVNIDVPYTLGFNWDASKYGDNIKVDIYEFDTRIGTISGGTSNTVTSNHSVSLTGKIGVQSGEDKGDGLGVGYTFTGGRSANTSRNYSISAVDIVPVGTLGMQYQHKPTPEEFRNLPVYGYAFGNKKEYDFFKGSANNARLTDTSPALFIDVIRIAH